MFYPVAELCLLRNCADALTSRTVIPNIYRLASLRLADRVIRLETGDEGTAPRVVQLLSH